MPAEIKMTLNERRKYLLRMRLRHIRYYPSCLAIGQPGTDICQPDIPRRLACYGAYPNGKASRAGHPVRLPFCVRWSTAHSPLTQVLPPLPLCCRSFFLLACSLHRCAPQGKKVSCLQHIL